MKRMNIADENLTDNMIFNAAILTLTPDWHLDDASHGSNTFYWRMIELVRRNIEGTSCYKSIYEAVCHWGFEVFKD